MEVSWCETEEELRAVEALTYFNREFCLGSAKAVQAKLNGELAGGFWSTTEQFEESELGVRYAFSPNQVWLFAARVDKQHREKRVYSSILDFILPSLASQGKSHQLVAVNPNNKGSHRVHQQRSFRSPGTIFAMRIFKMTVCFCFGEVKCDRWIAVNSKKHPVVIEISTTDED
ncbi:MAG: hypothetical protein AB8B55_16310 [Mariniblastus sp.]